VLAERFARGQIDEQEYGERLDVLRGDPDRSSSPDIVRRGHSPGNALGGHQAPAQEAVAGRGASKEVGRQVR
jgi:hypothetical protein